MLKKLTAFLTAAVMVTSVASIPVLTSYADTNSTTEKRVMEMNRPPKVRPKI